MLVLKEINKEWLLCFEIEKHISLPSMRIFAKGTKAQDFSVQAV